MLGSKVYEEVIKPNLEEIAEWALLGWSYNRMAHKLGIATSSFCACANDKGKHALQKALAQENFRTRNVEDSLYSSAIGYWRTISRGIKCKRVFYDDKERRCEQEEIKFVEEEVWFPADTMAIKFYLINRNPLRWKEKVEDTGVTTELLSSVDKIVVEIKNKADSVGLKNNSGHGKDIDAGEGNDDEVTI